MRVLIVGAGPTGLTAAVELARRGIEITIIDKRDAGSGFSRAVGIIPRSLEALEPSGVTEKLLAEGMVYKYFQIFLGDRRAARISVTGADPKYDFLLGLAQDRTEGILRETLEATDVPVGYGHELIELEQRGGKVFADIAGMGRQKFDVVIGADGVRSRVRQQVGINFPGHDLPETWSIADVDSNSWPYDDGFTACRMPGGSVAVVAPLEPGRYRVISNTEDALKTLPLNLDVQSIRRQGQFKISVRQAETYHLGNVFLAGDAAHCHSPVGGRGMNLGIADAAELAQCLANGDVDNYSAKRHAEGAKTIAASESARKMLTSPSPASTLIIRTALKILSLLPPMQRKAADGILHA